MQECVILNGNKVARAMVETSASRDELVTGLRENKSAMRNHSITCSECDSTIYCRGLCQPHYNRAYHSHSLLITKHRRNVGALALVGTRFGRLLVTRLGKPSYAVVQCDCGNAKEVRLASLRVGDTQSCGCLLSDSVRARTTTHGMSKTPTWAAWFNMRQRCGNSNHPGYARYGGRGITVCKRWLHSFENFLTDMGECPLGLSLERVNNNGNYEPDNCKWATLGEQSNNKCSSRLLTFSDKTQTIAQWAHECGLTYYQLLARVNNGWTTERALTAPFGG